MEFAVYVFRVVEGRANDEIGWVALVVPGRRMAAEGLVREDLVGPSAAQWRRVEHELERSLPTGWLPPASALATAVIPARRRETARAQYVARLTIHDAPSLERLSSILERFQSRVSVADADGPR